MATRRRFLAGTLVSAAAVSSAAENETAEANAVTLRTHEWFGDRAQQFEFPREWRIKTCHMNGVKAPMLLKKQIRQAIQNPVATKRLQEIAAGKRTAAITFDDLTRPTPAYAVVPFLTEELRAAGIKDENILFVAGSGSHYAMNAVEVAKKLGPDTVNAHPWVNHNIWENFADLGVSGSGNPLAVNAYYYKADVKITISGVQAQSVPGYGGGPEAILPGISSMKSIRRLYNSAKGTRPNLTGPDGKLVIRLSDNVQRTDMIEAARRAGVDFSVQIVCGAKRRPVHVVAGDIVQAHNAAARYAVKHLGTEYARDADIIVVNTYPRSAEMAELLGWGNRGLRDGGSIVFIHQNPMGECAWDYLDEERFYKGGSFFARRAARKPLFPAAGQVIIYSQYLQKRELDHPAFPPEALGLRDWHAVIQSLGKLHKGDGVKVAVYPCAGVQHGLAKLDLSA